MSTIQRVIYVPPWRNVSNPSEGVVFELAAPYIIGSPRGTGGADVKAITASAPLLSGLPVYNVTLADRTITFFIHIKGKTRQDMYAERKRLGGLLTPYNGAQWETPGRLYYQNDDGIYWIDAIPISSPEFGDRIKNYNRAELKFQCPDPAWKSAIEKFIEMTYKTAAFRFPFKFDPTVNFGTYGYNETINNEGQLAAPLLIKVSGTGIENPTITNKRTGEFIRIILPIPIGAILLINTSFWRRRVELYLEDGTVENAYHYIDLESTFFQLLPGDNVIDYSSNIGNENATVNISWYEHYAGV